MNPKRKAKFCKLNRKEAKIITRLHTGHSDLRYHRHKMGILENPKCFRCGEEEETSKHSLCHYPALVKKCQHITGHFFLEKSLLIPGTGPPSYCFGWVFGCRGSYIGDVKRLPKR